MIPDFLHNLLGMAQLRSFDAISGLFRTFRPSWFVLIGPPIRDHCQQAMVENLNWSPMLENLERLNVAIFDFNNTLDTFVTPRIRRIIRFHSEGRQIQSSIISGQGSNRLGKWSSLHWNATDSSPDECDKYLNRKKNSAYHTTQQQKDDHQKMAIKKQYLLRPVDLHRRKIPEVSKGTLKKI